MSLSWVAFIILGLIIGVAGFIGFINLRDYRGSSLSVIIPQTLNCHLDSIIDEW